uniref:Uncharacterized protein n=1 Tax=Neovison vison TaxID=452646 RepID=A0A8C7ADX0_NEOVI
MEIEGISLSPRAKLAAICKSGRELSLRSTSSAILILDWPASKTVMNKCQFHKSMAFCYSSLS